MQKYQTLLGIFLWTLILLSFSLIVLITISYFWHIKYASVVWTPVLANLATLCIYVLSPFWSVALSINILFSTLTSRFIISNVDPASDFYLIVIICTNLPSVKIWSHVFPTMDLSFANIVSIYNLQFGQRSLFHSKYFSAVSVVSDLISHYPALYIVESD